MFTKQFVDALADAIATRMNMRGPIAKRILTIAEASEYLGLSECAIRHKVSAQEIPVTRIDRYLRFDRLELDRWIEKNTEAEP